MTNRTWEKNKAQELAAGTGSSFGGYTVYNLTVEDDHTFFVGSAGGGTWVHNTCVYRSTPGQPDYVGITDNFAQRAAAHLLQKGIDIEQIPGLGNLVRADARGVEQALIDNIGLAKNGGTLINKMNSISALNPIFGAAKQAGTKILKRITYPGF